MLDPSRRPDRDASDEDPPDDRNDPAVDRLDTSDGPDDPDDPDGDRIVASRDDRPERNVEPGRVTAAVAPSWETAPITRAVPGTPDEPRVTEARDASWTWPLISIGGLVAVAVIAWLANVIPFNGMTTTDVADRHPVPYGPATWTWTIWAVVLVLSAVFVLYCLFPGARHNRRLLAVGPLFLVTNLAIIAWLGLWHWEQFLGALGAAIVALVALLMTYFAVRVHRRKTSGPSKFQRLVIWTPFSIAVGAVMNVTLVTLMTWWLTSDWPGGPFSLTVWAWLFIVGGVAASAVFAFAFHDPLVPLVFVWTFIGIASQQGGDRLSVTILAVVGAVLCAGLAFMGTLLEFDTNAMRRISPRKSTVDGDIARPDRRDLGRSGRDESQP